MQVVGKGDKVRQYTGTQKVFVGRQYGIQACRDRVGYEHFLRGPCQHHVQLVESHQTIPEVQFPRKRTVGIGHAMRERHEEYVDVLTL